MHLRPPALSTMVTMRSGELASCTRIRIRSIPKVAVYACMTLVRPCGTACVHRALHTTILHLMNLCGW